jgi:hypothetical protein
MLEASNVMQAVVGISLLLAGAGCVLGLLASLKPRQPDQDVVLFWGILALVTFAVGIPLTTLGFLGINGIR